MYREALYIPSNSGWQLYSLYISLLQKAPIIIGRMKSSYKAIQNAAQYEKQIDECIVAYERLHVSNFHIHEAKLMDFLLQQVRRLKKEISLNKAKTSQQNLDLLIARKRSAMEARRQKEEIQWRELTSKLKKFQEEEKILRNQNNQAEFDVRNLNSKIQQFKNNNQLLRQSINNLELVDPDNFITQARQEYKSPYKLDKFGPSMKEKRQRLAKESLKQGGGVIPKNKCDNQIRYIQNSRAGYSRQTKDLSIKVSKVFKQAFLQQTNHDLDHNSKSILAVSTQQRGHKQFLISIKQRPEMKTDKMNSANQQMHGQGHELILKYLSVPGIRDRVFDILRI